MVHAGPGAFNDIITKFIIIISNTIKTQMTIVNLKICTLYFYNKNTLLQHLKIKNTYFFKCHLSKFKTKFAQVAKRMNISKSHDCVASNEIDRPTSHYC